MSNNLNKLSHTPNKSNSDLLWIPTSFNKERDKLLLSGLSAHKLLEINGFFRGGKKSVLWVPDFIRLVVTTVNESLKLATSTGRHVKAKHAKPWWTQHKTYLRANQKLPDPQSSSPRRLPLWSQHTAPQ